MSKRIDNILICLSIAYVILPIVIFVFGWIKIYIAIPFFVVLLKLFYDSYKNLSDNKLDLFDKDNIIFWIEVIIVLVVWAYFSGIGGFTFQNSDYWARNPMYRDLIMLDWPIIFDISKQSDFVKEIAGASKVAYSYYFAFWLTPALICKMISLLSIDIEVIKNIIIYLYALLGIFLVTYNIIRYFNKKTYVILFTFIFFSGLDIVGALLINPQIELPSYNIGWWSIFFEYSANTILLYYVFNQAIPLWIIIMLYLQVDKKYKIAIAALTFAYSPWATIGFVPIVLAEYLSDVKNIKEAFSVDNIFIGIFMLIIYATFYTCGNGSQGITGNMFNIHSDYNFKIIIRNYIVFVFFEVGIFYIVLKDYMYKCKYYFITLIEFILYPLYQFKQYSFHIRGTIVPLFLLMIMCIDALLNYNNRIRKTILVIVLSIGAIMPTMTIGCSIYETCINHKTIYNPIYSFDDIKSTDSGLVTELKDIYFKYEYEDSFFFKYLAKECK